MVFLLVVIYVAFIGLGIPDSLIGSAWPAIHAELGIPVEMVSIITFLISGCTVLSSMFSAKILNKLGTAKVTALSTAMTALSLFTGNCSVPIFPISGKAQKTGGIITSPGFWQPPHLKN